MNPTLNILYGMQKLCGHDLYMAECMPLMRKRLLLDGKADNPEIDNLFEMFYRLSAIGGMHKNPPLMQIATAAQTALKAACDVANDKRRVTLDPSTSQKRDMVRALDALASLATTMNRKTYFHSRVFAAAVMQETMVANEKILSH